MEFLQPTVIDTKVISAEHPQDYFNTILSSVNDHIVRIGIMTEPYFWHLHPNSDETFLVLEGTLLIDLETGTIELQPGQLLTIPKNMRHRTRPGGERSVNLTIEHQQTETIMG
ncbi:cupin domain-containing protein [Mucilaginibacter sp. HC2]|uniref:cupin domain-containing protein n=1 Tax=Mucilaginibacter inviolabilis TaxID=2714892 RepID=UPI001407A631|nr:cupin domain-containing protein [Mucilaginibacter inviolabilis]NHA04914.1 cupin domain-containing protein [Mucilaginibacter inviolabilis]